MYRCLGHPKPIRDNPSKARSRATVRMQLREFKNTVRGVAQRTIFQPEQREKIKPGKIYHEKFLGLAVKGKHPALDLMVDMDPVLRSQVEYHLITLGHTISARQVEKFRKGELSLRPNVPNLNGRAGWDSNIKILRRQQGEQAIPCPQDVTFATVQEQNNPTCLQCPHCNASVLSNNKAFQLRDLDIVYKCRSCKQRVKVQDWLCVCHHRWHLCNKHQSYANSTNRSVPSERVCTNNKRAIGPLTQAQLQEVDAKRIRRTPPIILPPAPNILSVKLQERFAYLFKR